MISRPLRCTIFFFFNDTATTEIYTLSLHDALPILAGLREDLLPHPAAVQLAPFLDRILQRLEEVVLLDCPDRKSTRLNSSHANISYAVFCLKKNTRHYLIYRLLLDKKIVGSAVQPR